jgi:signal peptidase II
LTPARVLGGITMVAVFALDQASKFAILHGFGAPGQPPRFLTPFLDLTLNWNRGISFSLLPQYTSAGIWLLLGFTVVATALLGVWLWFARTPLVALGLGAIIGGALGNGCDRLAYGAVIDFLDLHAFGRHFFVFNVADAAINIGVALLIFDGLFGRSGHDRSAPPEGPLGGDSLSYPSKRASGGSDRP